MPKIRLLSPRKEYSWNGTSFCENLIYPVTDQEAFYLVNTAKVAETVFDQKQTPVEQLLKSTNNSKVPDKLKIALIRIGGIGDSLILAGLAKAVKRKYPNSITTLYIRDRIGHSIIENNPSVDKIVICQNMVWEQLLDKVLLQDYDMVYDNRYATKVYYKDVKRFAKDKLATDKCFEPYIDYYNKFPLSNYKLSQAVKITERQLGIQTANLEGSDDDLYAFLKRDDFTLVTMLEGGKYVTVHNASDITRQTKCWNPKKWTKVVSYLKTRGYKVIQLGHMNESVIEGVIDLTGRTSLAQTVALLAKSSFHLDSESGLVHLARAVRTRSIVLFGPTPPHFFGYEENVNVETPFKCKAKWWSSDMWWRECPEGYPMPVKCMDAITEQMVVKAVDQIIKLKPLENRMDVDLNDINEKFAMELPLGESHYRKEQCQWDRIYTMMNKVKGKKVLEVGAGDGYCVEVLMKQGFDVTAIEISKIRLKRMQDKGLKALYGDVHKLPFPDNSFDTVICGEVLEHIPSMAKGMAELERVCKPEGRIILSLPIGIEHSRTEMHLWKIDHSTVLRNGKADMIVMALDRIHGNEKEKITR